MQMKHHLATPLLILSLLAATAARAQTPLPAVTGAAQARLNVQQFSITGNSLLPEALLMQTLEPYKGERGLAELQQAAAAVQALYRQAGYGGVIAYLPEQNLSSGTLTIAVLEGHFGKIGFSGNARTDEATLRRSLPLLREGAIPQTRRLDAQIQLANENPARQVAVSLEPGVKQGEVDAQVLVKELPPSRWTLGLDNTGNAATGRLRTTVGYQRSDLWGLDHVLSLQYQTSPEKLDSVSVLSAGYRVPLYDAGLVLDVFAAHSDVDGGRTATVAGPLQFDGKGEVLGLRLGGRLVRDGDIVQRFAAGLDRRAYLNNCSIEGLPAGACGSAGESVVVHPMSLDYLVQWTGSQPASLQLTLSQNFTGGRHGRAADFEAVRPGANPGFMTLKLQAARASALPAGWQLQWRLQGQASPDALVPGEQLGLGGANAVRGYGERELIGDQGLLGSLEVLTSDFSSLVGGSPNTLRGLFFADAGKVWNHLGTPCRNGQSSCALASVGLGLRAMLAGLQLHLDLAHTLKPGLQTDRHDQHVHLTASYSFP
ncbi:MAG TPA: ShlB/FhaC/HecB family hemolysin secretion/activation protein [Roseateles sp.]